VSRGKVTALRNSYGFIRDEEGASYFFHLADLVDAFDVKVGDEVTFEPEVPAPAKGPRARGVSFSDGARS
jgi:cold shock CspA family protein